MTRRPFSTDHRASELCQVMQMNFMGERLRILPHQDGMIYFQVRLEGNSGIFTVKSTVSGRKVFRWYSKISSLDWVTIFSIDRWLMSVLSWFCTLLENPAILPWAGVRVTHDDQNAIISSRSIDNFLAFCCRFLPYYQIIIYKDRIQ
jgi:hypothetical protein